MGGRLALLAAITSGLFAGCSSSAPSTLGSAKAESVASTVALQLQPVSGVTLNTVHYAVTMAGSSSPILEGDLPTSGTGKAFTFGLPIPIGAGYTISLSAVSVESATTTCTGSAGPFDIAPNQTNQLLTTLVCTDAARGNANDVVVSTDACPRLIIDYIVVSPNFAKTIAPNNTIAVASKAHDLDAKPLTYSWRIRRQHGGRLYGSERRKHDVHLRQRKESGRHERNSEQRRVLEDHHDPGRLFVRRRSRSRKSLSA